MKVAVHRMDPVTITIHTSTAYTREVKVIKGLYHLCFCRKRHQLFSKTTESIVIQSKNDKLHKKATTKVKTEDKKNRQKSTKKGDYKTDKKAIKN
mgnify:CR=1 FL=1